MVLPAPLDNAHDAVGRQLEVETFEQKFFAESLAQALGLNYFLPQTRTVGDEYLQTFFFLFLVFVEQFVVARQTGFALGLTGLGRHAHPFEFAFERLAAF